MSPHRAFAEFEAEPLTRVLEAFARAHGCEPGELRPSRRVSRPAVTAVDRVVMAMPLSLATNTTGRRQTAARFQDSSSIPWFTAPSPKKATATPLSPLLRAASAKPQARGPDAPTIPEAAKWRSRSNRCM